MPCYFMLCRKGAPDKGVNFNDIDDELRFMLGLEFDSDKYVANWYDYFTVDFALGVSITEARKMQQIMLQKAIEEDDCSAADYERLAIIKYLENNYTVTQWREHGRRH